MTPDPRSTMEPPAISVVLPVYRNREALDALHARLVAALAPIPGSFELLFVNDCCPDGSLDVLRRLADRDPRVRVVALPERGGQMAALRAGLAAVRGRIVVTMDADLQDPPEAIPRLLAALAGRYTAVYAGRRGRYESSRRLVSSWIFKHAIAAVSGMPADAGSFIAMRREIADRVVALPDRAPYLTAAVAWASRGPERRRPQHTSIPVVRQARSGGRSSYTSGMRIGMGLTALSQALRWRTGGTTTARILVVAALALAGLLFATTHGDVGWDGMWMLQVIARVRAGEVLYRDVFCGVPPLAVYVGQAATSVFGVELGALRVVLVATVTLSWLVAAGLLARLTGGRRFDLVLAPMMFAWALPSNVPLYQPLANLCLLAALCAAVGWAVGEEGGRARPRAWLLTAGCAAGLSFAAKQTVGVLAFAAVLVLTSLATVRRRGPRAWPLARAWCLLAIAFTVTVVALLLPVAGSGGWPKFLEYGFLNKGTYLRVARVPYVEELGSYLATLRPGPAFDALGAVRGFPLVLPPLLVLALTAAWRTRRRQFVPAVAVALLVVVEAGTLFPRADIDHVIPAVPGFLVALLFAWHSWTPVGLHAARATRWAGLGILLLVSAMCAARLAASGAALASSSRAWSSLPHLSHVLVPKAREAELRTHAAALRGAAPDGTIFLLVPNAGLYYLVSGLGNPTPFDYPLNTAFGRTGESDLARAIAAGRLTRLCMAPVRGSMAPTRVQQEVLARLQPRANLGPCTLFLAPR